jgi:hypothetical protein
MESRKLINYKEHWDNVYSKSAINKNVFTKLVVLISGMIELCYIF